MAEPRVKGVAFRSVLGAADALAGPEVVAAALHALGPDDANMLQLEVVPIGWYPLALYRRLLASLEGASGRGDAFLRELGAASVDRDIKTVYRVFFRVLSPETVLGLSGKFFNQYYDTGTLSVAERGRGFARIEYRGCEGFDRRVWSELLAGAEATLRIAGARSVRSRVLQGGGDGDIDTTIEGTWE
ncbi:MAG: hypothetical protein KF901_15435 [Myxococcales bacterium]|nr:hypothetical protein [Myxococcales bacterium]